MYRACSRCGQVHSTKYKCTHNKVYVVQDTEERKLRGTNKWTQKSLEIREKANYLCEVCKDEDVYTYEGLEVHHIEKLRDRPELLLDNSNLVCLCPLHHKEADNGRLDKGYLKLLADRREKKYPPTL